MSSYKTNTYTIIVNIYPFWITDYGHRRVIIIRIGNNYCQH